MNRNMRSLMNLFENDFVDDADELDSSYANEKHVEKLIRFAFSKIGIDINTVFYDQHADREASVLLDDFEVDLSTLSKLSSTGLASSYKIVATDDGIRIDFQVPKTLDKAIAPE